MKTNENRGPFFIELTHGGLYAKKTGTGQWKFLSKVQGTLVSEWIDSCEQYERLSFGEAAECRMAFQLGFLQSLRILTVKLDSIPPHRIRMFEQLPGPLPSSDPKKMAVSSIIKEARENAFEERIKFRWKHTYALPHPENRRIAGKTVFVNEHWQHAASLRGSHCAMEYMAVKWNDFVRQMPGQGDLLDLLLTVTIPAMHRDSHLWTEERFSPSLLRQHQIESGEYECMVPLK